MDEFLNEETEEKKEENPTAVNKADDVCEDENKAVSDEAVNGGEEPLQEPAQENSESDFVYKDNFEPMNKITFSNVTPISDYKPMSKGIKVFALILAAVVLVTGSCAVGFFLGKQSRSATTTKKSIIKLEKTKSDSETPDAIEVYSKAADSVVGIKVYNSYEQMGVANGVVMSKDGYIVTNDHIYAEIPAAKFKVYTNDGKEYDAQYVAGDKISDLAILKVDGGKFTPAGFTNSDDVVTGQTAYAIGKTNGVTSPAGITSGIISSASCRVTGTTNYAIRLIETTCPINPGSSGGALVNTSGQVIGITASKLQGGEYDNVGYAIPARTVKRITDDLISNGKVTQRAKLGINYSFIDSAIAEISDYNTVGLYIASVSEESSLYGILEEGDIITEINGQKVTSDTVVLDTIDESYPGDVISITYYRNGSTMTADAQLTANIGDSSYSAEKPSGKGSDSKSGSGETFNFPDGE